MLLHIGGLGDLGGGESDLSNEAVLAELQHILFPHLWVAFCDTPMGRSWLRWSEDMLSKNRGHSDSAQGLSRKKRALAIQLR